MLQVWVAPVSGSLAASAPVTCVSPSRPMPNRTAWPLSRWPASVADAELVPEIAGVSLAPVMLNTAATLAVAAPSVTCTVKLSLTLAAAASAWVSVSLLLSA